MAIYVSASGYAQIRIITQVSEPSGGKVELDIPIPEEFNNYEIAIGGGVVGSENPGKLLTGSYPRADLSAWKVSAKDHLNSDVSTITGYAIGLQLFDFNMSPIEKEELMSFIHITSVTSHVQAHPRAFAPLWPTCVLLGGGFQVNWSEPGNLATQSFYNIGPGGEFSNAYGWQAGSKDHLVASPASITAYAIGIEDPILSSAYGFSVNPDEAKPVESVALNHPPATAQLRAGWVVTGGGADVRYQGAGNLLWKLQPFANSDGLQGFNVASKDHDVSDPCVIVAYAFGINPTRL